MTLDLLMASAAPSLTIQLPTIVAVAAVVITILLALLSYMVGLAMLERARCLAGSGQVWMRSVTRRLRRRRSNRRAPPD